LCERSFDAALIFTSFSQTPHTAGYVCYLAGIPLRAGESKEFGGAALTTELRGAPDNLHQAERNLRLVEALGFVSDDRQLEVQIPDGVRAATTFILRDAGIDPDEPFVLIHPGASATARRYPAERFAAVASLLLADGLQVLITGSDRERTLLDPMRTLALGARFVVGGTSVPEYAAIVERAALVVCNDSLPMHLADALRTPMIVLFSGTDLESQWEPRVAPARLLRHETSCSPCYRFDCPIGLPCLDFTPEAVAGHVLRMLHEPAAVLQGARS
ncbi:MAG: glycosyltransferase family 9 protein, partial [Chloroflexota bacterium]|nr:glycosyltransferase family 9 protein [Chloroflexota bacterium]